jgi:hypothetical protein
MTPPIRRLLKKINRTSACFPRQGFRAFVSEPFFARPPAGAELTKKQPVETKAVESLKEIGRRLARFPLKACC